VHTIQLSQSFRHLSRNTQSRNSAVKFTSATPTDRQNELNFKLPLLNKWGAYRHVSHKTPTL